MDIKPIFGEADKLLSQGEPFVLATVVNTKGSTPQKPGAKLLIRRDGSIIGTLGGGCVEADVWAEAKTILDQGGNLGLRRFILNEDIAAQDGLVCGGTMEILIDPLHDQSVVSPFFKEIMDAYAGKGNRALATLVDPGKEGIVGSRLFIREDSTAEGSLGNKDLDQDVIKLAINLMPKGRENWMQTKDGVQIYIESFTSPETIIIAGGGHVGKAVYQLAVFLGIDVVIVDDRPRFANKTRFPKAKKIVVDDFDNGIRNLEVTPNSYILVATRGHKYDDLALFEAAKTGAGYVGLLGSKRKAALIYRDLLRKGISDDRIREIHAPIGLDIGGRSPEEIALSIIAEMLTVKYGRKGSTLGLDERLINKAKDLAAKQVNSSIAAVNL